MFMSPISTSQIDAYNAKGGAQAEASDPQAAQDRFLKLFIAQLNNQDPMNPLDNAQMTSQMAQINTVTGIQQMNATLNSLGAQMSAATNIQATQLVGRDVVANGNGVVVENGLVQGNFTLASQADAVNVDILGRNGAVLGTVTVGSRAAGLQQFEWPLGSVDPEAVGRIEVRATRGGEAVTATPLARQRVDSVAFVDGAIRLRTDSGTLEYGQVLAFL